jgi:hypothetical protein
MPVLACKAQGVLLGTASTIHAHCQFCLEILQAFGIRKPDIIPSRYRKTFIVKLQLNSVEGGSSSTWRFARKSGAVLAFELSDLSRQLLAQSLEVISLRLCLLQLLVESLDVAQCLMKEAIPLVAVSDLCCSILLSTTLRLD